MRTLTKQSSIFSLFSRFKLEFLLSNSSLGVAGIAPLSRGLTCQLKFPAVFSLKKCETHMGTKCQKCFGFCRFSQNATDFRLSENGS